MSREFPEMEKKEQKSCQIWGVPVTGEKGSFLQGFLIQAAAPAAISAGQTLKPEYGKLVSHDDFCHIMSLTSGLFSVGVFEV